MIRLFLILAPVILKDALRYSAVLLAAVVIITRIWPETSWFVVVLGSAFLQVAVLGSTLRLLGTNLNWVRILPLTRRRLLAFRYLIGTYSILLPLAPIAGI